ncbi:hypothetical protein D3C76_1439150 [compost metagenome]
MNQTGKLKKYAELFEERLREYLASGISVHTTIYPCNSEGAVYEFRLDPEGKNTTKLMPPYQSVGDILSKIPQRMVGGDMKNVRFKGTNLSLENNRILVIKGEDDREQWTGTAASKDVARVVSGALSSSSR